MAISPFFVIASGARRSRLSGVGKPKREIASQARNDKTEERGDLDCSVLANRKARLLRRLAMTKNCDRERSAAISIVLDRKTDKNEIASQARNDRWVVLRASQ